MNSWQNGGSKSRPLAGRLGEVVSAQNELQRPVVTSATLANTPQGDESVVERWLRRGRNAILQYERDEKRVGWMYRKMEAFARRYGERLSILRRVDVLDHLTERFRVNFPAAVTLLRKSSQALYGQLLSRPISSDILRGHCGFLKGNRLLNVAWCSSFGPILFSIMASITSAVRPQKQGRCFIH